MVNLKTVGHKRRTTKLSVSYLFVHELEEIKIVERFRSTSFCSDRRCRELADYTYLKRQINGICMILSSFFSFSFRIEIKWYGVSFRKRIGEDASHQM